jgi:hypothetical protein
LNLALDSLKLCAETVVAFFSKPYLEIREGSGADSTIEIKINETLNQLVEGVQTTKCIALALTTLTAVSIAIAPAGYATSDFDGVRCENLDKDTIS